MVGVFRETSLVNALAFSFENNRAAEFLLTSFLFGPNWQPGILTLVKLVLLTDAAITVAQHTTQTGDGKPVAICVIFRPFRGDIGEISQERSVIFADYITFAQYCNCGQHGNCPVIVITRVKSYTIFAGSHQHCKSDMEQLVSLNQPLSL